MYIEKTMHDTVINNNNGINPEENVSNCNEIGEKNTNENIIIKESLRDRIYFAAKDGFSLTLLIILKDLDQSLAYKLLNQKFVEEDGQTFTPLVIAAKNGRYKVVRMLLKNYPNIDLEAECAVNFDGHIVHGVGALWAAAGSGHLTIVKLLIHHGADVNHQTQTDSTPLRAACFEGRLDVVEYLVAHGADLNIANAFNNSCLMIASFKGHTSVVEFLLKNGALVNERALCQATALHYASEMGHYDICRILLEYGAIQMKNEYGMSPVIYAAEKTRESVVELFCTWNELLTKKEKIDALELIGASFANDKDNYNITKAYKYMLLGMELRYSDSENIIRKPFSTPIPAYDNWIECQTIAELQAIEFNHNSLHMEALTIRERILGNDCPEIAHPIIFRGAVFADNGRFDRCEALWMHALKLRQNIQISVQRDLLRFAQVFSQMIQLGEMIRFDTILSVLECCITEIESNRARLEKPSRKDDVVFIFEENELNTTTALYLLTIITKCLKARTVIINSDDLTRLYRLMIKINKLNLKLKDGQTLLHLAVNGVTPVDDFHTNEVCRFPCVDTVKMLLKCGAKVNVFDLSRNTPLHTLVSTLQTVRYAEEELILTVEEIVKLFYEHGMHFDAVNSDGLVAGRISGISTTNTDTFYLPIVAIENNFLLWRLTFLGNIECLIRGLELKETTLKCLASRCIAQHKIQYQGTIPKDLESFVQLHSASKL
uniref:Protein fem-1 homolog B n=1 Tax=Culicoides sonorensis TaxID=179676 RepID=A0A336M0K2_CULSO